MFDYVLRIAVILWIVSLTGYIFIVLKEKIYLKNNMIYLDYKNVDPDQIKEVEIKHFKLGNHELMAGDEIKVKLKGAKSIKGTVLGLAKDKKTILLMGAKGVKNLEIHAIKELKVASKYGKFF
ncbi:hypothetical protein [Isachenkonia alkalipeptolytica]|uniref:Uncharacterized protein n=1 Tax=Isachenkonia alkalipeptolytica TaxID=2565777 RepID=A0AA43XM63_9CLOT|nr:hypothetical protein [Isachenkonia alkalipeptolytica]NBG89152.1 hypothetical protein [Isachenkonia alkalipeptolytica]